MLHLLATSSLASGLALTAPHVDPPTVVDDAGLAWADIDADGLVDALAVAPNGALTLLRNMGDGTFEDRSVALDSVGLAPIADAAWGDFDADGLPDLFVVEQGGAGRLLQNGGVAGFADVTLDAGFETLAGLAGARWTDYDGDSLEDLVVHGAGGPVVFHNQGGFFATVATSRGESVAFPPGVAFPTGSLTSEVGSGETTARGVEPLGTGTGFGAGFGGAALGGGPGSGPSSGPMVSTPDATGTAFGMGSPLCLSAIDDFSAGSCLSASSNPVLGMLYPLSQNFFVSPDGYVGLGTLNPVAQLQITSAGYALDPSVLLDDDVVINGPDSVLSLFSGPGGSWGSVINLAQGVGSGLTDKWSIARTTQAAGSDLRFSFGTDPSYAANPALFTMEPTGAFGIGTTAPSFPLHIDNNNADNGFTAYIDATDAGPGAALSVLPSSDNWGSFIGGDARFGYWGELFGAALPVTTAMISTAPDNEGRFELFDSAGAPVVVLSSDATSDGNVLLYNDGGVPTIHLDAGDGGNAGLIVMRDALEQTRIVLDASQEGKGRITTDVLEITGGADIVESFDTREDSVEPGTVVVIDAENPGELRTSTKPYDKRVAGIVSGAGGVDPGLSLGQEGVASGDTQVALTGRVYVKASAENGPIAAGDRLTTAATLGHAMRVHDDNRAIGAVIGKAMSELDEGTGLVLVLVNLQ